MEFLLEGLDEDKLSWTDRVDYELYKNRKIYLNEYITQYTFETVIPFIEHINIIDKDVPVDERKPIELAICSGGGSFHDGIAVISAIKRSKTPIKALVYSYAYSMGLAIAMACDEVYMSIYGSLLYHEVSTGVDGNNSQIKRTQKELDRIQKIYDNLIIERSSVTQDMLNEQKEKINDWVIDFEEAKKLNLVNGSVEELD